MGGGNNEAIRFNLFKLFTALLCGVLGGLTHYVIALNDRVARMESVVEILIDNYKKER